MQTILLTGGTGYIGSHCCIRLLESGKKVIVLDNLCNSKKSILDRIELITAKSPIFIEGDIRDEVLLETIFTKHKLDAVLHMAGLKAVGESTKNPLLYYEINVEGSRRLIQACQFNNVKNFVFSSSATVYGEPDYLPLDEKHPLRPANPYGETKRVVEDILRSVSFSDEGLRTAILRYFNPVGAHESGLIGEDPNDTPNNLMPLIAQVATGERTHLDIYGNDYPTEDGTGVRDYIHVEDLVDAHILALDYLLKEKQSLTVNLGTGKGFSVLEMANAFSKASGKTIALKTCSRRQGDAATSYTNPSKADELLGWTSKRDLKKICEDQWRWSYQNLLRNGGNN